MKAIVLVGGFGTRLRPLTLSTPKQMLPVVNRPMIERVLAGLAVGGVTDAVLSLGYRPDAFIDRYPNGECAGVRLHYAVEPEPLPEGHWLYTHPRVRLSPHTSWQMPGAVDMLLEPFLDNLRRYQSGRPLIGIVDPAAGY